MKVYVCNTFGLEDWILGRDGLREIRNLIHYLNTHAFKEKQEVIDYVINHVSITECLNLAGCDSMREFIEDLGYIPSQSMQEFLLIQPDAIDINAYEIED